VNSYLWGVSATNLVELTVTGRPYLKIIAVTAIFFNCAPAHSLNPLPVQTANDIATVKLIIRETAIQYGIDPDTFLQVSKIESSLDPKAYQPGSRAAGLFQFIPSTAKLYSLQNPFDPRANADAAARFWKDNETYLSKSLRRPPSAGELYLAHQQGAGTAAKLIANPNASAIAIAGKMAVLQNGGTLTMTAGQFAQLWISRFK
jgi:hypothetical protein